VLSEHRIVSDFGAYVELGFRHITDLAAADHILFLLALAAIYRWRDWRDCVWVVTAFTVGHSITLALAVSHSLMLPPAWIEFLIPVTIIATGLENVLARNRVTRSGTGRYRPFLAGLFGLVHGAGFANYLRSLFVDDIALPLFGFNVGIELGQLCVLVTTFAAFAAVDPLIRAARLSDDGPASTIRLRALAVSSVVLMVATRWAVQRAPW
jgi:HupE/UreJ protein